jgi:5-methylcytosine-specific restriction endonuclease McrA
LESRDFPSDWPELRLEVLRRDGYRCRSCGKKGGRSSVEAIPVRPGDFRLQAVVTLCPACRSMIDQLRDNEKIAAVFFYRKRTGTKYYVATSHPAFS